MNRKQAIKISKVLFASDTNRTINEFEHLKAEESILTSESVDGYLGKELPHIDGLDKDKIYNVYRPASELKKAINQYNDLPLTDEHYFVDGVAVHKDKWIGGIGSKATFKNGKVYNTVAIWDKNAVPMVRDNKKIDLSCGYKFRLIPESGVFNGKQYDYKMADIVVNHVALVKVGRNQAAQVADTDLINKEKTSMKHKPSELLAHIEKHHPQIVEECKNAMGAKMSDESEKEAVKAKKDDCYSDKKAKKDKKAAKKAAKKAMKDKMLKMDEMCDKEDPKKADVMAKDEMAKLIGNKVVEYNSTKSLCEKVLGKGKFEFAADASPIAMINETLKMKNIAIADSVSDESKMVLVKYIADTAPAVEQKREPVIRIPVADSYTSAADEYKKQF
jgi:hypothetical protein